jgi:hypothetical protein
MGTEADERKRVVVTTEDTSSGVGMIYFEGLFEHSRKGSVA